VGGAFVQLKGKSDLRQAQRGVALAEQVQYGEGPVESLDFIGASQIIVPHYDSRFHQMIYI
jgi:hypothetical protein